MSCECVGVCCLVIGDYRGVLEVEDGHATDVSPVFHRGSSSTLLPAKEGLQRMERYMVSVHPPLLESCRVSWWLASP
jgi:hypothetical protein